MPTARKKNETAMKTKKSLEQHREQTNSNKKPNRLFALAAKLLKADVPLPIVASKDDTENPDLGPFNEIAAANGALVLKDKNRRVPVL